MTSAALHGTRREGLGLGLGLLGVLAFSGTVPATVLALHAFSPGFVALGRAALAGLVAGLLLLAFRQRLPRRDELRGLALAAAGVVFGFPLLMTWALRTVEPAHGSVVLGILPLATATCGALLQRERPSPAFWLTAAAGSATVVAFALWDNPSGGLHLAWGDLALLAAIALAALGYAEGARVARSLGGWQTICWALVLSLPILLPLAGRDLLAQPAEPIGPAAWSGFLYVALISQLAGFFAWYRGLALGGVARVSQLQLLQPFVTLVFVWLVLARPIGPMTLGFAVLVVALVGLGRRATVSR
ncbi:Permease of the drug/metabolite transporter (DMT) superfamily [Tistlia consotensis]|uniref:Permease of the drug/metabolite transporter (DMT) superfamily n=1 Tax=Tistlia consotensis USBA 355 TaxID=560819 RepID=A0A1Y6C7X5_9PROT|nr:DMT family transporter [Tistlia consotensis]SMF40771.1 Permease of the drug/metabolite transporter (DMT) superfamily [Tistlia consotensis USBA 355]SNR74492.1 Permease of the drug/metabolite transporter (DMT) superfamily [Tistlia consotensis]